MSYQPKVYRKQGGNDLVVASGGSLDIESGGSFEIAGVQVTASAADLNKVDALTASAAELEEATVTQSKASSVSIAADVLAIPVTAQVVLKTTGADAEALELANGTAGQQILIHLEVDGGGDGTLSALTSTGFDTIVFADAGDYAFLKWIDDTLGWMLIGHGGLAAPPVVTV